MKALQALFKFSFAVGFTGFLATEILDLVYTFTRKHGAQLANNIVQRILQATSPHFVLARCVRKAPPVRHRCAFCLHVGGKHQHQQYQHWGTSPD